MTARRNLVGWIAATHGRAKRCEVLERHGCSTAIARDYSNATGFVFCGNVPMEARRGNTGVVVETYDILDCGLRGECRTRNGVSVIGAIARDPLECRSAITYGRNSRDACGWYGATLGERTPMDCGWWCED